MSKSAETEIGDHFSAVSVVDSTSNFGDRINEPDIPYDDSELDDIEDKAETQSKDNNDGNSSEVSYFFLFFYY